MIRNRRGYSALLATIIMVLVVMFLFYNVYMFMLNRDTDLQNIISRSQQLDADRSAEILTILNPTTTGGNGLPIIVACTLVNNGSVPIQVVRLWLKDLNPISNLPAVTASLMTQNVVLQPGASTLRSFQVTLPGAFASDTFALTLVSSRGNSFTTRING
jgi:hypothetical protein